MGGAAYWLHPRRRGSFVRDGTPASRLCRCVRGWSVDPGTFASGGRSRTGTRCNDTSTPRHRSCFAIRRRISRGTPAGDRGDGRPAGATPLRRRAPRIRPWRSTRSGPPDGSAFGDRRAVPAGVRNARDRNRVTAPIRARRDPGRCRGRPLGLRGAARRGGESAYRWPPGTGHLARARRAGDRGVSRPHGSVARGHTWPADRTLRAYSRGGGARRGRCDREPPGAGRGGTPIVVGGALARTAVLPAA